MKLYVEIATPYCKVDFLILALTCSYSAIPSLRLVGHDILMVFVYGFIILNITIYLLYIYTFNNIIFILKILFLKCAFLFYKIFTTLLDFIYTSMNSG